MKSIGITPKITFILNFFLAGLLIILLRLWYLSIVQHEYYLTESRKPQTRVVVEKPARGGIYDRFGIPLAINAPQYNAAIYYADIRQIPMVKWEENEKGKKVRVLARKKYINELANFLAKALSLDPLDIEDMIHAKACLFPHTPFVLMEDLPEDVYYRLKGAERNWLGLQMQQSVRRIYPKGKLACDVIGYMGAISPEEYLAIGKEMKELRSYMQAHEAGEAIFLPKGFSSPEEVRGRLLELEENAYTINDQVGKSGIEAAFDERLRGAIGKSYYEIDIQGNILQKLPEGKSPRPGERITLTISSELQEEAEKLLAHYEYLQDLRDAAGIRKRYHPWQRGSAIVAMDPNNGEILAFASYPRFDPNDLTPMQTAQNRKKQRSKVLKWLENPAYIGEIWDGKRPMEKEIYKDGEYKAETFFLTWDKFLDCVLGKDCAVKKCLDEIDTIQKAIDVDEETLSKIPFERDKSLLLDLLDLVVPRECFTASLLEHVGEQSLSEFRFFCQISAVALSSLKEKAKERFHQNEFRYWREEKFKNFLKERRKDEKARHRFPKPYTDYLERKEREMFFDYWAKHRDIILLDGIYCDPILAPIKEVIQFLKKSDQLAYVKALRGFDDLGKPLKGSYPYLRSSNGVQTEKHLATAFYPYSGFGYGRSHAFRQSSPMGSIFKVVPAFAGLKQQYDQKMSNLNPLTLIDDMQWTAKPGSNSQVLGYFKNGHPIHRLYKGGRLPRAYPKIGEIDVTKALERSSNIYFSILAGDILESPSTLMQTAISFGLGRKTGIDLPGEYAGLLPCDITHNKTGLYSFAIGQHSLVVTPLQAAVLFSTIANGGKILKPQIFKNCDPIIKEELDFPEQVRDQLIEGMRKVINGERGSARPASMRAAFHDKEALKAHRQLAPRMIGKTGTAEIMFKQSIDAETPAQMEKHVWFAGIGFKEETLQTPQLVIVVYTRFGSAGRQGAPITAKLFQKWQEIQAKR